MYIVLYNTLSVQCTGKYVSTLIGRSTADHVLLIVSHRLGTVILKLCVIIINYVSCLHSARRNNTGDLREAPHTVTMETVYYSFNLLSFYNFKPVSFKT